MTALPEELLKAVAKQAHDSRRRTFTAAVETFTELPLPATDADFGAAECHIGRTMPTGLKQLYQIANGGFGPGSGLLPLELVARMHELRCAGPFGPLDQPWPSRLLVLCDPQDVPLCLDMESGEIVAWEADRIEDEASQRDWDRSFVIQAESLEAWIRTWLSSETFEQMRDRVARETTARAKARGISPVTGFAIQFDDVGEQIEAELAFLAEAPDLREVCGLPKVGWEREVRMRWSDNS